jgi:hypothetical protein|tara:strand:+ start:601 stop:807 length:207 start_codon:yes stop_codon:yes gene_type:complete
VSHFKLVEQFCLIQLQVLFDREIRLRKDLQDCVIQREYLSHFLAELNENEQFDHLDALVKEIKLIGEE